MNIILASITFLAVLVALFQERIDKYFNRTAIKIQIIKKPPDCHQILLTDGQGNAVGNCIYSRLRITNLGRLNTSFNTEVFMSHFWKILRSGNKAEIKTFLPMNLKWSHTHKIKTDILPSMYRYCDLGSFRNGKGETYLLIDTIVKPNPVSGGKIPNVIEPGKYLFEIVVSGENMSPQITQWRLEFGNIWDGNEQIMLENIHITEVKGGG